MRNQRLEVTGPRRVRPNPDVNVSVEMMQQLVRLFTGSTIAIVPVGRGRREADLTALVAVRAAIMRASLGLAAVAMSRRAAERLTPKPEPHFEGWNEEDKPQLIGVDLAEGKDVHVEMSWPELDAQWSDRQSLDVEL